MNTLPEQYVINKFYQYSNNVKYFKISNSYRGGCPSCREGSSWGRKARLNYYISQHFLMCYNCQKTWSTLNWIKEVSGLSYKEIIQESQEYDNCSFSIEEEAITKPKNAHTLPHDSINLMDEIQIKYYEDNYIIKDALALIKNRRLNTAINRCKTFYISLNDYIHKNRLCIPFYDSDGKIRFFQSRAMYPEDEEIAKYLSKSNSDKTIFGLNQIDTTIDYLFVFEGPIDSMFVKNGISMAGLQISDHQKTLLNKYILYKRIWVLDNQLYKEEVFEKNIELIENGETIFIWPQQYKPYKDLNELCCKLKLDSVSPEFFIKNSYSGDAAKLALSIRKLA
jgi:hypothetical protein